MTFQKSDWYFIPWHPIDDKMLGFIGELLLLGSAYRFSAFTLRTAIVGQTFKRRWFYEYKSLTLCSVHFSLRWPGVSAKMLD